MSLGVGLEQELGDEFGVDFDELDEFVWVCCVFAAFGDAFDEFGGVFFMSLGVGLEQELEVEFGVEFDDKEGKVFGACVMLQAAG